MGELEENPRWSNVHWKETASKADGEFCIDMQKFIKERLEEIVLEREDQARRRRRPPKLRKEGFGEFVGHSIGWPKRKDLI